VAERTLQNARTAQSYSASIRKKNAPGHGVAVDIGQSPTFGTELVTIEPQTPLFATAQQGARAPDTPESPYHLMDNDLGGGTSPLARPLEPIAELEPAPESEFELQSPTELDAATTPVVSPVPDTPAGTEPLIAPNLNADIEAEAEDDASFVSLNSNPPPAEEDDLAALPASELLPEATLVEEPVTVADDQVAHVEDGVEANIVSTVEHAAPASYLEAKESKHPRPYMSYQRLMGARRNNRASARNNVAVSKAHKTGTARKGKTSSIFAHHMGDSENAEEVENRELYYNEMAWLLGGTGRWNIDQDLKEKAATMQQKAAKLGRYHASSGSEWNPAAQMSMTSPRMVTDAASDAGAVFSLNMQSNSQWKLEENPGMIRCMAVNPIESMLLTCSRTGVRLWSLTSHPLLHVSSYTHHSSPPFAAGFLRCGSSAATCDGNIHIWDIETRHTISFLSAATAAGYNPGEKGSGFTSMSIIAPRDGIMPSMGAYGDDQLITTMGATLSYHDLRLSSSGRGIMPVADWIIPQLPAPQGNFISSTLEPLQLTCAASHDNYLFTGSTGGGLWIIDRRMGKVLTSWQAHEGPVLKVNFPRACFFAFCFCCTGFL
jgi:hypothetical protein